MVAVGEAEGVLEGIAGVRFGIVVVMKIGSEGTCLQPASNIATQSTIIAGKFRLFEFVVKGMQACLHDHNYLYSDNCLLRIKQNIFHRCLHLNPPPADFHQVGERIFLCSIPELEFVFLPFHVVAEHPKIGIAVEEFDQPAEQLGQEQNILLQCADVVQREIRGAVNGPDAALGLARSCHHRANLFRKHTVCADVKRGIDQSLAGEFEIERIFNGQVIRVH